MLVLVASPQLAAAARATVLLWPTPSADPLIDAAAQEIGRSDRLQVLPLSAVLPLLKDKDADHDVTGRLTALYEGARQAVLALDHETAARKLDEALELVSSSFVAIYDPPLVAQLHVLRGVVALGVSRPDRAREAFLAARRADENLVLDAHYSPQVRQAFEQSREEGASRATPEPAQIRRVLGMLPHASLAAAIVADPPRNDTILLKALVYDASGDGYAAADSQTLSARSLAEGQTAARALGRRLRGMLEHRLPKPKPTPALPAVVMRATPSRASRGAPRRGTSAGTFGQRPRCSWER